LRKRKTVQSRTVIAPEKVALRVAKQMKAKYPRAVLRALGALLLA
jgi:hypothetical protein